MGDSRFALDPRAPLFFVSYARARATARRRDPDDHVLQFFEDLSIHVSELTGRPTGADPGYLDRHMAGGRRWTPELLGAAATCQVFIPLISAALLRSEWCGREWWAFSHRTVLNQQTGHTDHETAIIPVAWLPVPFSSIPRVVQAVQTFSPTDLPDPSVAKSYHKEGIYGLLTLRREDEYQAVVWRLALRVVDLLRSHWVKPARPMREGALRNVFVEEGR